MTKYIVRNYKENNGISAGSLYYDENLDKFNISINSNVPYNQLPIYFSLYAKKGKYDLNDNESRKWLSGRLTSKDRQNIGSILKDMGLYRYDENSFIKRSNGRCGQDDFEIVSI